MKWFLICTVFALSCMSCCTTKANQTHKLEWQFLEQAALQSATALEEYVISNCKCQDGKFLSEKCRSNADKLLVVKYRVPWHVAMAMYNDGLIEKRPSKTPPVVPAAETLCPKEN